MYFCSPSHLRAVLKVKIKHVIKNLTPDPDRNGRPDPLPGGGSQDKNKKRPQIQLGPGLKPPASFWGAPAPCWEAAAHPTPAGRPPIWAPPLWASSPQLYSRTFFICIVAPPQPGEGPDGHLPLKIESVGPVSVRFQGGHLSIICILTLSTAGSGSWVPR